MIKDAIQSNEEHPAAKEIIDFIKPIFPKGSAPEYDHQKPNSGLEKYAFRWIREVGTTTKIHKNFIISFDTSTLDKYQDIFHNTGKEAAKQRVKNKVSKEYTKYNSSNNNDPFKFNVTEKLISGE